MGKMNNPFRGKTVTLEEVAEIWGLHTGIKELLGEFPKLPFVSIGTAGEIFGPEIKNPPPVDQTDDGEK